MSHCGKGLVGQGVKGILVEIVLTLKLFLKKLLGQFKGLVGSFKLINFTAVLLVSGDKLFVDFVSLGILLSHNGHLLSCLCHLTGILHYLRIFGPQVAKLHL